MPVNSIYYLGHPHTEIYSLSENSNLTGHAKFQRQSIAKEILLNKDTDLSSCSYSASYMWQVDASLQGLAVLTLTVATALTFYNSMIPSKLNFALCLMTNERSGLHISEAEVTTSKLKKTKRLAKRCSLYLLKIHLFQNKCCYPQAKKSL